MSINVAELVRFAGVICGADFLSYCVVLYVLWPTRLDLLTLPDDTLHHHKLLSNGWPDPRNSSTDDRREYIRHSCLFFLYKYGMVSGAYDFSAVNNALLSDSNEEEVELFETTSFITHRKIPHNSGAVKTRVMPGRQNSIDDVTGGATDELEAESLLEDETDQMFQFR